MEAGVERQEDGRGLEPHHAAEGVVQVALRRVRRHATQGGVVHGPCAHVLDQRDVLGVAHEDHDRGDVDARHLGGAEEVEQQVHHPFIRHHHDCHSALASDRVDRVAHLRPELLQQVAVFLQQRQEQQVLVVAGVRIVLREILLVLVRIKRSKAHPVALLDYTLSPLRYHGDSDALVRLAGPRPCPGQVDFLARRVQHSVRLPVTVRTKEIIPLGRGCRVVQEGKHILRDGSFAEVHNRKVLP